MEFSAHYVDRANDIVTLFEETFAASEGADEGRVIGTLAQNLIQMTNDEDLFVFSALKDDNLVGCIIFSRLTFAEDDRTVFILSPVAVKTDQQGSGVGKTLLKYGLNKIREHGVDVAITYGDPNYYGNVGFTQITEAIVTPPLTLQQPEGWLAQSLTEHPLDSLKGGSRCVDALNDPAYW